MRRICGSQEELEDVLLKLKTTACPNCKRVGHLIRHGFLRGYDEAHQLEKTVRARRVFCSNRNRASGCGKTFSIGLADRIRRLFWSADSLWSFLKQAVSDDNKLKAFQALKSGLTESAPYRIWKRFSQAQSAIRTALAALCKPPQMDSRNTAQLTLAHLEKAFVGHSLSPIAAFQRTLQIFFI